METIEIAPGLSVLYGPAPGEPEHAAIAAAYRDFYVGVYRAVVTKGADRAWREAVADSDRGIETKARLARTIPQDAVEGFSPGDRGSVRLTRLAVESVYQGKGAALAVCVDRRGVRPGPTAGKRAPASRALVALAKGQDGRWRVSTFRPHPNEQAKECLR
ncbi:hypothetical protein D5H75_12410 [Bailinhaonella thermotolerans]|uniref:Uncharacterized protein n=1 Tax=Bailinhaonella thermotolerans TaxID=1070861 RepID=A0A3A4B5E2_9ACTN|nr:hypothetical protein D5H75_12410 [Bailinhaonella thermotolerans]